MAHGQLVFVGLGLFDENDISLRGLQELKKSDVVYAEMYTSKLLDSAIPNLEKKIGKPITILDRTEVEHAIRILDAAETKHVVLLVCGDPMMATTHIDLRLRASIQGIQTRVIHNSSIVTAASGLVGLQNYKFGRSTTLPYPHKQYFPLSPYEAIAENKLRGLHTLVLLDIQAEQNRYMTANEGLDVLLRMAQEKNDSLISKDAVACVVARAGSPEPVIVADVIASLQKRQFGPPLHTLLIPGDLHFLEVEALRMFAGLPEEIAKKIQKL